MATIKELVIAYLRHDRKFATGARLYNQYGQNQSLKQQINRREAMGNVDRLLHSMLNEELAALAGISVEIMLNYLRQPLVPLPIDLVDDPNLKATTAPPATDPPAPPKSRAEELEGLKVDMLVEHLTKLHPEFKRKKENKGALIALIIEQEAAAAASMKQPEQAAVITEIPQPVKEAMKLRQDYPFLAERDCPPVLKALVGKKLEAYDAFRFAHEDLFTAENFAEQEAAALAAVENYLENQEIFDELNHYAKEGKLLGNHPAVKAEVFRLEIEAMSAAELAKERSNLQKSIAKYNKQIAEEQEKGEAADAEKIANWQLLVDTKTTRFNLVEARLETLK